MARRPTTVTMDEKVIEDLHAVADRLGVSEDEVVEQAVRRFVSLDVLDDLWARNHLPEDEAEAIAAEELSAYRSGSSAS
jgi:hypothetical protein